MRFGVDFVQVDAVLFAPEVSIQVNQITNFTTGINYLWKTSIFILQIRLDKICAYQETVILGSR